MQINLIADDSVSSAPAGFTAAVQAAAHTFDQDIPGNYSVNITYGWGTYDNAPDTDLSPSSRDFSLGGPDALYTKSYSTVKTWLTNAAVTSEQIAAVASLPSSSPFSDNIELSSSQEKALASIPAVPAPSTGRSASISATCQGACCPSTRRKQR